MFWKLLNKLDDSCIAKKAASNLTMNEWMNHYKNLLHGHSNNPILPLNVDELGPLDYEINIEELLEAKIILKPGKAGGIDIINNEMISESLTLYPKSFLHFL